MTLTGRVALTAGRHFLLAASLLMVPRLAEGRVLDDFNDNTKTGWTDFTFVPGLGIAAETGGQLRIEQRPAGQALFSASRRTSELLELKEGRTLEMRVDLVEGGARTRLRCWPLFRRETTRARWAGTEWPSRKPIF